MVNRGEMIVYLTKAGFPVEVARLIEWFGRVSQIRIEYFMRGLPPLSIMAMIRDQSTPMPWPRRGHIDMLRTPIPGFIGINPAVFMSIDDDEYKPSWGYLQ